MTKDNLAQIKIDKPSDEIFREVKRQWDSLAKPLDSLGEFEGLIARIGAILGSPDINIKNKAVIVMCADNGIVNEGISQSGQEVTAAVAGAMGKGQSSVCRMASHIGAKVIPVDIGIASANQIEGVLNRKIMPGTRNFLNEPAMTEQEALDAIGVGIDMAKYCKKEGYSILAAGEMGIGNTTTGSATAASLIGTFSEDTIGRGAGLCDESLEKKRGVIRMALEKYRFDKTETLRILTTVGGLDIAGMTGLFIGSAMYHLPIVIDGVISAVAALVAERLVPGCMEYMIPSHISREKTAGIVMDELGLKPVIDASMALGEGTGAVMMFALLDMALALYDENTIFSDIGIEAYTRFETTKS